jgi:hypothetical protein
MQIDHMKISCKEDVHICRTNFAKKMERNLHERTSRWKMYGKQLFFEDLEVRDEGLILVENEVPGSSPVGGDRWFIMSLAMRVGGLEVV